MRFIWIICLIIAIKPAYAGFLADELSYHSQRWIKWQRRHQDLMALEANLYRRVRMHPDHLERAHTLLEEDNIDGLSGFLRTSDEVNRMELTDQEILSSNADKVFLDNLLTNLPKLELESYRGELIDPKIWANWQVGGIHTDLGFFQSRTTLIEAMEDAGYDDIQGNIRVITKIEGKQGRLLRSLSQTDSFRLTWPTNASFEIINKDFDPVTQTYYLHLREMSESTKPATSYPAFLQRSECL
ncbi:MAG: hypothetical protein ISP86_01770 [Shewanellaceae bacterium]|nr:hypothetical protein [Shewanellaceae bacterium]